MNDQLKDFQDGIDKRLSNSQIEVLELFLKNIEEKEKITHTKIISLYETLSLWPDTEEKISFKDLMEYTINYLNSLIDNKRNNHPINWLYYRLEKMLFYNRPSAISRATISNLFHIIKREEIKSYDDFIDYVAGGRILIPLSRTKKIYMSRDRSNDLLKELNKRDGNFYKSIEDFISYMNHHIELSSETKIYARKMLKLENQRAKAK